MNFGIVGASVRGMFLATLAMEHGHKLTALADPSAKNGKTAVDIFNAKGCDEYVIRPGLSGGHGGGDSAIVKDFIECITKGGIQPKAGIKATHDAALIAAAAQDAIEQKSVINLQV